jgi:magnesium-transporting ATPase (P-type)
VLKDGILEGRKTFANTMKYIHMDLSSNFGNMFSVAAATTFLPFLPMLPVQILLNNFLYDSSQVAIPTDNVDASYVRVPRRWDMRQIRNYMILFGLTSSVFDMATFFLLYKMFPVTTAQFRTGWFMESLATQILVVFVIVLEKSSREVAGAEHPVLPVDRLGIALPALCLRHGFPSVAPEGRGDDHPTGVGLSGGGGMHEAIRVPQVHAGGLAMNPVRGAVLPLRSFPPDPS